MSDPGAQQLHHIGYVVQSLNDSVPEYRRLLELDWDGRVFHDPLQKARVTFLSGQGLGTVLIELVEPAGTRSPVRQFADQGGGIHHLCYEVENLPDQIQRSQQAGATLVRVPMPAVAFEGRRVAWVRSAQSVLIEYLQR